MLLIVDLNQHVFNQILEPSLENLQHLAIHPHGFEVYEDEFDPEDIDSDGSLSSTDDFMNEEFLLHKRDYYMNKLEYDQVTPYEISIPYTFIIMQLLFTERF